MLRRFASDDKGHHRSLTGRNQFVLERRAHGQSTRHRVIHDPASGKVQLAQGEEHSMCGGQHRAISSRATDQSDDAASGVQNDPAIL
jgi:hypothetical protein